MANQRRRFKSFSTLFKGAFLSEKRDQLTFVCYDECPTVAALHRGKPLALSVGHGRRSFFSHARKAGNSRQNVPAAGEFNRERKNPAEWFFRKISIPANGRCEPGTLILILYRIRRYGVYCFNRLDRKNGKIGKIEKYLPFRTSGNRNLYLGCNRRHAACGPHRGEIHAGISIRRVQYRQSIKRCCWGATPRIPSIRENGPWLPPRGNSACGLPDISENQNDLPACHVSGFQVCRNGG